MTLSGSFARLRSLVTAFGRAERGNVIIMFALATVPLIGFVGAAVDYSRANSAKVAMQAAIDSAGLMLSKQALSLSQADLSKKAADIFTALVHRPELMNIAVTPTFTKVTESSYKLNIEATATVPTSFTKLIGKTTMNIAVSSEILWGIKRLELALALDNTGSMSSSNKMTELKKAAKTLIATLKAAVKNPGDIKIAIVPFDYTVNIGTGYKDQPWFDYANIDCNGSKSGKGCTSETWKNYWDGCVRDRTSPYDVQDTAPTTSNSKTLYPVFDCSGSLATVLPLTDDWSKLTSKVDAMTPTGNTNVTIGLVWAWHAVTPSSPLTEATPPADDLDKVIILLTDGDNTKSWDNANGKKITSQSKIDARTELVCTNVKAAGIKLYTIRVINGNASLLKKCASSSTMYFDVKVAADLDTVFASIAQSLANLRIAK